MFNSFKSDWFKQSSTCFQGNTETLFCKNPFPFYIVEDSWLTILFILYLFILYLVVCIRNTEIIKSMLSMG